MKEAVRARGSEEEKPTLLVITGPTASGKSALALSLAQRLGGEIVNGDSVQFYRGCDIGAAKPSAEELCAVPHHLYSFLEPTEPFSAGDFCRVAAGVIAELTARRSVPIVTGGTGLYIRALLNGIVETEQVSSEVVSSLDGFLREREERGESHHEAVAALHGWLQREDPESAAKLAVSDLARIRRALAVKLSLGRSLASLQEEHQLAERPYRALVVCVLPEREWLYRRIDSRCDEMLQGGLLDEVRGLLSRYPTEAKPFSAIGYRHARLFLDGEISYEEMVQLLKRDTRRFAKRQYTWWRHQPRHLGWREVSEGYQVGGSVGPDQAITDFLYRKGEFSPDFSTESVAFLPVQTVEWGAALAGV